MLVLRAGTILFKYLQLLGNKRMLPKLCRYDRVQQAHGIGVWSI